jgi:hypothetical protein
MRHMISKLIYFNLFALSHILYDTLRHFPTSPFWSPGTDAGFLNSDLPVVPYFVCCSQPTGTRGSRFMRHCRRSSILNPIHKTFGDSFFGSLRAQVKPYGLF